ncbi:MAG: hypothetical protein ACKOE8_05290 [Opitutaceae bacterium]
MIEIRESDWKKFTALLPVWRERYLTEKKPLHRRSPHGARQDGDRTFLGR